MRKIFYILIVIGFKTALAQGSIDVPEPMHIKTVILKSTKDNKLTPIFPLKSGFSLSFDDLEADLKYYYYKITHCNFDWTPSQLTDREYIKGYDNDRIRNETNSFNTLQFFTHYEISFPNQNTEILLSGNYIISILDEDENTVFTRRFVLYETQVSIEMNIQRSRNIQAMNTKQNVQFTINYPNLRVNNPKAEIKTVLMQNYNWDTAILDLEPQYLRGSQLIYKYLDKTDFYGGSEFHYFDNKAVRFSNVYIKRVDLGPEIYHTFLYTDLGSSNKSYSTQQDINGDFVIRNIDAQEDSNIEADYTWVFFSLIPDEDLSDKKIYVSGKFNNWQNNALNEMIYNPRSGQYETQILMKQGFYNYQYVTVDQNNKFNNHDVDGSYYQTENDYVLLVYYNLLGSRTGRVVGFKEQKSVEILN